MKCEEAHFDQSVMLLAGLVELDAADAATIYETLLACLKSVGIDDKYLKINLIGFC